MVLILMGVVGSGKTTVGTLLASKLGWQFADADDFHPPENVSKISQGIGLTDADRLPWLAALAAAIQKWNDAKQNVVLACSALKRSYRGQLGVGSVQFVYLKGSRELIQDRLRARHGHFASATILDSQFQDLQEPTDALTVSIAQTPDAIVEEIVQKLKLPPVAYPSPARK